jgi:Uma2 family endonuclease
MTLGLDLARKYTYSDYITWTDDIRRELLDGFIHIMSAPRVIHGLITTNLTYLIKHYIRKAKKYRVIHSPVDVVLSENTVVQPDVVVINSDVDIRGTVIYGVPEFLIEVVSPSSVKKDMLNKHDIYEKFGVKEYWVVVPESVVYVFILKDGKYEETLYNLDSVSGDLKIKSTVVDGLEISVNELFEDL